MKIFVTGCSHTEGTHKHPTPFEKRWPGVVKGFNPNFDITDLSVMGGSNQRIYRSTISRVLDKSFDIALIQWTHHDRFELPTDIKRSEQLGLKPLGGFNQFIPRTSLHYGQNKTLINREYNFFQKFFIFSEEENLHRQITTCVFAQGLDSFLKQRNIRPIHIFFEDIHPKNISQYRINDLENLVDPSIGLGRLLFSRGYKYRKDVTDNFGGPDRHFGEDGHYQIAEWVCDYLDRGEIPQKGDHFIPDEIGLNVYE